MNVPHGVHHMMADPALTATDSPVSKPRRVRTGCLTCRERHLKCDEAQPVCQNCRKSNRQCKRGVRLNFIDTQVRMPQKMAPIHDWNVQFHDESRDIASEYRGGLARYGALEDSELQYHVDNGLLFDFSGPATQPAQQQPLPPIQGIIQDPYAEAQLSIEHERQQREASHRYNHSHSDSAYSGSNVPAMVAPSYTPTEPPMSGDNRDYIRDPKELCYMQAFVEEVGVWMDSMDAQKHFSEQLPHIALTNNMLYNAYLACGARHLALVNPQEYSDEAASQYYNTATSYLLQNLQNDTRDTVTCATTATILNVYEVMSERFIQRMNHIKGARALIQECGWNAKSTGVGAACFWINIGMEVLSCLAKNFAVAWEPDEWGVDMDFSAGPPAHQHDELWTHRVVYVVAKIANFRASKGSADAADSPMERQSRMEEWQHLKSLLDSWNRHVPRSLHPMGYVDPFKTRTGSVFPEVWLIKRPAIMARLLYHTGLLLLAQLNPMAPKGKSNEMRNLEMENAMIICGIVAHNKDRGVASIAIRAIGIAGEVLTDHQQQTEVLMVLKSVAENTGWIVHSLFKELPKRWGWPVSNDSSSSSRQPTQQQQPTPLPTSQPQLHHQGPPITSASQAPPMRVQTFPQLAMHPHQQPSLPNMVSPSPQPSSQHQHQPIAPSRQGSDGPNQQQLPQPQARNPLAVADFGIHQHPYQPHYVAPNPNMGSATMPRHGSTNYF